MKTKTVLDALVITGLLTELWALATGDTTVSKYIQDVTRQPLPKLAGAVLAFHFLVEAEIRNAYLSRLSPAV